MVVIAYNHGTGLCVKYLNYWNGMGDDEVRQENGHVDSVQEKMSKGLW